MNHKDCLSLMLLRFFFYLPEYFSDLKVKAFTKKILIDCFYSIFVFFPI